MADIFAPYISQHASPAGPGDGRPTALQIINDENLVNAWPDKVILVTGGTSGIGVETVRALHATGARLFFTARDEAKAQAVLKNVKETSVGKGTVEVLKMDMDSLESVKGAAEEFLGKSGGKLNILVNNAGILPESSGSWHGRSVIGANWSVSGIMATPESQTVDGFERQFGVNHLAHFTLTVLLLPALISSSTSDFNSRVVNVSSSSHRYSSIHWQDFNLRRSYDPYVAYGQSKTANIWTANYIDRNYGVKGVHSLSLHPGGIWSGLQQYADPEKLAQWKEDNEIGPLMKSPEQGASTSVWAAVAKVWEGKGGKYLADCRIAPPAKNLTSAMDDGVGPDAYNEEGENKLWALSEKLTGVEAP